MEIEETPVAGQLYKYCEGETIFEVIGVGKRIDTKEDVVCCVSMSNQNNIWVIPLELWFGTEGHEEKVVPRFTRVVKQDYPIGTAYPPILKGLFKQFIEEVES